MAVERQVTAAPTVSHTIQTSHGASGRSKSAKVQNVDVAVVGADVAGLAVALASVQAQPGSRVMVSISYAFVIYPGISDDIIIIKAFPSVFALCLAL